MYIRAGGVDGTTVLQNAVLISQTIDTASRCSIDPIVVIPRLLIYLCYSGHTSEIMSSGNVFTRGLSRISRRKKRRRNLTALEQGPSTPSVATTDSEYLTQASKP
ncbi:unnamed protein product [Heligmosomoides polygyrus]|uniref:Uncharacterized protein n=1 Tax=Heligmosomoides polygyrus TaxID=6339 RepID=A0A3P8EDV0_HELPZ|nr:unnamed protein product [Heligmosomoides polygyrus]